VAGPDTPAVGVKTAADTEVLSEIQCCSGVGCAARASGGGRILDSMSIKVGVVVGSRVSLFQEDTCG
jgi:hypothetical protein